MKEAQEGADARGLSSWATWLGHVDDRSPMGRAMNQCSRKDDLLVAPLRFRAAVSALGRERGGVRGGCRTTDRDAVPAEREDGRASLLAPRLPTTTSSSNFGPSRRGLNRKTCGRSGQLIPPCRLQSRGAVVAPDRDR